MVVAGDYRAVPQVHEIITSRYCPSIERHLGKEVELWREMELSSNYFRWHVGPVVDLLYLVYVGKLFTPSRQLSSRTDFAPRL